MGLKKQHREALINELEKAKEEKDLVELVIRKKEDDHLDGWHDIRLFMAQQKIKLIEQSLIDNQIDFYMKPQVRAEDFLDWLFADSDDAKQLGVRVIKALNSKGTFTITTRQLFEECGYIPVHILDNKEQFEEDEEFVPSEVELID